MAPASALDDAAIAARLSAGGLEVVGRCDQLSSLGPQVLHSAALLEDFTPAEIDTLGQSMLAVRVPPGRALIREGEVGEWMLLLLAGTVDVTKRASDGRASRLAVIRPGAAIGEMSMLDGEPRYATCTAIDAVEAGVLSRASIAMLIRDHPGVGAKLLVKLTQLLAQRLRNTSNQMIRLVRIAGIDADASLADVRLGEAVTGGRASATGGEPQADGSVA
jgi:CRP-like cAMP-binding protein